ncbi:hypothetical protein OH733_04995 [Streptomyces griseus]|uniref:Deoxyribonuclease NucA/NucB domain-containing protein n=1 Tax=Streptomyces sp. CMC78 TaxID=3231512 RepID=A0AB33KCQ5_9ACTN|nr:hypothetical protein OH733_04995 [Streptomyces griseus]WTD71242.1 hypothetical protein OH763_31990 [Streptomyces griseus]
MFFTALAMVLTMAPQATGSDANQTFTKVSVTDFEGKPFTPPTVRKSPQDRKRDIRQEATAQADRSAGAEVASSQRTAAADFVDMSECWDALGPGVGGEKTIDHFTWCSVGIFTVEDVRCTNGSSCQTVGSVTFRMSLQGMGNQGADSSADRMTRVWLMLDEPVISNPPPRMDRRLKFSGTCSTPSAKTSCSVGANDGDTDSLQQWIVAGHTDFDFNLPAGTLTDTDRIAYGDFMIKSEVVGNPLNQDSWIFGPENGFRCDSSPKVHYHGCVYPDVISQFSLRATPDVSEEARHVWKAQNEPNLTLPTSVAPKSIPGSRASGQPLERMVNANDKKANNSKSAGQCRKYWGRGYSRGNTRQCDEYPFQSTYQGSAMGGAGVSHFSVDVISTEHNRKAGEHLDKFYNEQRILDLDRFYVVVLAADGKPYGKNDATPSGPVAPIQYPQCANSRAPLVRDVKEQAAPTKAFLDYAKSTPDGWTGGDSTYSVTLPDGRRLWVFSDTFLGPLNGDGTRPVGAKLVNSTFVIQDGDSLTTITGGTKENPEAIMPPSAPDHWYWAGDAMLAGIDGEQYLQVTYQEYQKFGEGAWDWRFSRNVVATFSLDDLSEPERVDPLPSDSRVAWGSAVLEAGRSGDEYTYIYGVSDAPINKKMRVARVKGTDLSKVDDWQFFDMAEGSWMRGEREGATSLTGIANEYSVTPWNGGFVLVSQDSTEAFSGKIRLWHSCSPYGPYTSLADQDLVYRMPEPGPYGSYWDGNIISYNAHVHPSLRQGDVWTLSYNVNSMDNRISPEGAHYRDPGIYKPRFVSFRLVSS